MTAAVASWLRRPVDLLPMSPFRWSGTSILLAAVAGPIWNVIVVPAPGASLTIGRALIVATALLLAFELWRAPRPRPAIPRPVWLLAAALAAFLAWTVVNALGWGCRCSGEIAGLSELAAICVLAACVAALEPRLRPGLVVAIIAAATLTAALTLLGVGGLSEGMRGDATIQGRAAGPYGNANMLALALAFAIPAAAAVYRLYPARARLVLCLAIALVAFVLVLTFSRSGVLTAVAGLVVVLVLRHPRGSRARRRTIAGIAALAVVAVPAYPVFVELRRDAPAPLDPVLRAQDRSGWDGRAQGLIGSDAAGLANPAAGELEVRTTGPGQGVSRGIGVAPGDGAYDLRLDARAVQGNERLGFGLEDNIAGNGPALRTARVSERWEPLHVRWEPTADSPEARLYVWSAGAGRPFRIRDVRVVARSTHAGTVVLPLSTKLQGSLYAELEAERRRVESREIDSRVVGVKLSLSTFAAHPVLGAGWGDFTAIADAQSEYGPMPTHNEYLRVLAELGAVGIILLATAALAIGVAARRAPRDELGLAVIGMLATGGVGLVFMNGLVTTGVTLPLALGAAIACARAAPAPTTEATPLWPVRLHPRTSHVPRRSPAGARLRVELRRPQGALARVRASAPDVPLLALPGGSGAADALAALRRSAPAPAPLTIDKQAARRRFDAIDAALRRWQGSRIAWALGIGALALIVRVPLMLERHEIVPGGDSADYVDLARHFLRQGPASLTRPPGYPLFLALADSLPGRLEDGAVVAQLAIGAALCAALVFVAWPLFGRLASITAGVLAGLTAPLLSIEGVLLADFLFGALASVSAGLLIAAALSERRRTSTLIAAGAAIALAVYVKPVGHALVLAPILPLAVGTRSVRATCLGTAVVAFTVALATVPWMARNEARYGSFTMSAQTGSTLFNRVFERDGLAIPTDLRAGRVAEEFRRAHPDTRLSSGVRNELMRGGATSAEADSMMREVALTAAWRAPLPVAEGALSSTRQMFGDVASGEGDDIIQAFVTGGRPLPGITTVTMDAIEPLRRVWEILALFGAAALLWFASHARPTRVAGAALLGAWASVALATAVLHGGQFRYSASLAPITWLLGSAGLVVAAKLGLELMGVLAGRPRPTLSSLVRAAATPSAHTEAQDRG